MDVPARTSYVMAVVSPAERPAAAAITNVPRSLAAALPPLAAGWMLDHSTFGWPLIIAGLSKIAYDLILLVQFRDVRPPEEMEPDTPTITWPSRQTIVGGSAGFGAGGRPNPGPTVPGDRRQESSCG
jgi:MFS family permease